MHRVALPGAVAERQMPSTGHSRGGTGTPGASSTSSSASSPADSSRQSLPRPADGGGSARAGTTHIADPDADWLRSEVEREHLLFTFPPSISVDDPEQTAGAQRLHVTADIDSVLIIGRDYDSVITCCSPPDSVWNFESTLDRTKTDSKSRVSVKFASNCQSVPSVTRRKPGTRTFLLEWFPSIHLCTVNIANCTFHVCFHHFDRPHISKCGMLTNEEIGTLCAAFNYAKIFYENLLPTATDDALTNLMMYNHQLQALQRFVCKTGTTNGERHNSSTFQPSISGRLFFRHVFEALALFSDDIDKAVNPMEGVIVDLASSTYTGLADSTLNLSVIQSTAQKLHDYGLLTANAVGTKAILQDTSSEIINFANPSSFPNFLHRAGAKLSRKLGRILGDFREDVDGERDNSQSPPRRPETGDRGSEDNDGSLDDGDEESEVDEESEDQEVVRSRKRRRTEDSEMVRTGGGTSTATQSMDRYV